MGRNRNVLQRWGREVLAAAELVDAASADALIGAWPAIQGVPSRSAAEPVIGGVPKQSVRPFKSRQAVRSVAAFDHIGFPAAEESVRAPAAEELVLSGTPFDDVGATTTADDVAMRGPDQHIRVSASADLAGRRGRSGRDRQCCGRAGDASHQGRASGEPPP